MSHPGALSRYVESRVRKLADNLSYLPLCRIRLLPKKLPLLTVGGHEGVSYLVGFDVDRERLRGDELHMTNQVEAFRGLDFLERGLTAWQAMQAEAAVLRDARPRLAMRGGARKHRLGDQ